MACLEEGIPPSITCDIWTAADSTSYISFELFMVSEWVLQKRSIGCVPFDVASHTGEAIKDYI